MHLKEYKIITELHFVRLHLFFSKLISRTTKFLNFQFCIEMMKMSTASNYNQFE